MGSQLPPPDSLLAVVVVYGRSLERVAPLPLLQRWRTARFKAAGAPTLRHVLVWNNSPGSRDDPPGDNGVTQRSDHCNGGTRAAYVAAVDLARSIGAAWLLLLDQDTVLPDEFPTALGRALKERGSADAAALVPRVLHEGQLVSPAVILQSGRVVPRPLDPSAARAEGSVQTAIASGTVIRTSDLHALLPIPEEFWLDFLDHWLFLQLHRRGRPIRAVDVSVHHHLSVKAPETMSALRYRNVLRAEGRFIGEMPARARLCYRGRLVLRAARLLPRTPALSWLTLRSAWSWRTVYRPVVARDRC